jgi:hypothetical protein
MMIVLRNLRLGLVLVGFLFIACSHEDSGPSSPPIPTQGKILIVNQADVPIRLTDFVQVRGGHQYNGQLNYMLFAGYTYYFHNKIDPGNSDTFPGGDLLTVHYVAAVYDPGRPDQPLFEDTVHLAVDGTTIIHVKTGGSYSIDPG